ncbi:tetratricopeptide repeat protein [Deinococcus yavapaiensis]|uniref:Tetratricopeptide repeat protein n=1 Tax=Deinococcus yavapaiensis KR-236 TaxID=694435 RepID=A0A318S632_9DEIO|nr:tetratricopeptide repeat protein [Deinococcus yavapaiensis]PYE49473.1 tetratricopeptide repeat protein [Deinococcus yavapaiensis KR-236]
MNRLRNAALLAVLLASTALAQTNERWVGWSDASPAATATLTESQLEYAFANRFPNRPDIKAEFSVIVAYERALATMKPTDPNYKTTQAELSKLKATAKGNLPGSPSPVKGSVKPIAFAEALNNARQIAYLNASQKDIDALAKLFQGKTTAHLQGVVATAVLKDRPAIALAALLAAHTRDAKNPNHLVNAAGLLSLLGMPYEALAFLDEAGKLGSVESTFVARAVVLNARGHALLTLGKFAEAESVLREAVKLDPTLSEAKRNLALALRAQNKRQEAMTFFAAGSRRAPVPKLVASTPPAPPAPGTPTSPPSASTPQAPSGVEPALAFLPAQEVYDLSRGRGWKLPSLKYPKNVQDGPAFFDQIEALRAYYRFRMNARQERIIALGQQKVAQTMARIGQPPSPGQALADERVHDILFRLSALPLEPALKRRFALVDEELSRDEGAVNFGGSQFDPTKNHTQKTVVYNPRTPSGHWNIAMLEIAGSEARAHAACTTSLCHEAVKREHDARRCPVFAEAHRRWRTAMLRLDGAYGELLDPVNRVATGLASNIGDPLDFELAQLHARQQSELLIDGLLAVAMSPGGLWGQYESHVQGGMVCDPSREQAVQPQEEAPEAFKCPVTGAYKLKVDFKIAELSGNCEKIAVEFTLGGDILIFEGGAFTELEYAFEGEVTLTLGGKIEASAGATAGAKAGVYIKVGADGSFKDFGVKQSTASGVMLGPVGGEIEIEKNFSLIPG